MLTPKEYAIKRRRELGRLRQRRYRERKDRELTVAACQKRRLPENVAGAEQS